MRLFRSVFLSLLDEPEEGSGWRFELKGGVELRGDWIDGLSGESE
jgi:hypothetical protein